MTCCDVVKQLNGAKATKTKSPGRKKEDPIVEDYPDMHMEEDLELVAEDMSYKKLVLKLRGFLVSEKSKDVKDPNITKSVLKKLKVQSQATSE